MLQAPFFDYENEDEDDDEYKKQSSFTILQWWAINIFPDIGAIWQRVSETPPLVLIDIPIGLPRKGTRACDVLARSVLKKRASSVFPVPCRKAIQAFNYRIRHVKLLTQGPGQR